MDHEDESVLMSGTRSWSLEDEMTMHWPLRSSLPLGALPTATPCARLHARHVLWEWGLHSHADTAELLVSELVTNGVHTSRAMEGHPPVWLRLSTDKVRVLIEVWDGNIRPPEPRDRPSETKAEEACSWWQC